MRSHDLTIDVTRATGLAAPTHVAATLHLPDTPNPGALDLLFCIHGASYRRSYWHPPFGDDSYSFARFFTGRGKAVLTVDTLGMGESSQPEPESQLSRLKIAAANAHVLTEGLLRLTDGTHASSAHISVTGIGHSMGGMLLLTQAAAHGGMDRIAILGWTNQPLKLAGIEVSEVRNAAHEGYAPPLGAAMRGLFYLPDVPDDIITADEVNASVTPASLGRDALTPGIVHEAAAAIAVPVLLAFGAIDTSPDPANEPSFFKSSPDVTLHRLAGAAHCHNMASTRADHWRRLDAWIDARST